MAVVKRVQGFRVQGEHAFERGICGGFPGSFDGVISRTNGPQRKSTNSDLKSGARPTVHPHNWPRSTVIATSRTRSKVLIAAGARQPKPFITFTWLR